MSIGATSSYLIPQEFEELRETIRAIAQEKIVPRAPQIDRDGQYPNDIRQLLAQNDILGLPFTEEHGGTGTGTLMLQMAVEEIAKADASCALILMLQELGTLPIQRFGTEEQKQRVSAEMRDWGMARWLRALGGRVRLERRGDAYVGAAGR
jgi:alkylation response protein AidB-like acyl-CoA dehydrogenase